MISDANNSELLGSPVGAIQAVKCAGTAFHTRRLKLPNGKGWIEIRGEFNPFDFDADQRLLISMIADWFSRFERTYSNERTTRLDLLSISLRTESIKPDVANTEEKGPS